MSASTSPPHHGADGRFHNPWPEAAGDDALRSQFHRVVWQWASQRQAPDPGPDDLPRAEPAFVTPVAEGRECRITWVGHATFLVQLPGLNVLTDPVWSERVSPVGLIGARRFVPAIPTLDALPPIDAVLISHDHYDHLDRPTIVALRRRHGDDLTWLVPLGHGSWFRRLGIERVTELDWWAGADLPGGQYQAVAAPARHWTRRTPWGTNTRLWCSWVLRPRAPAPDTSPATTSGPTGTVPGPCIFFAGDSGYGSLFAEIGRRLGPFDVSLIPIGAYEPRWFMKPVHMDPEEAIRAYRDLGAAGLFVPAHWGTFRLTFEPPLEPPHRARAAWDEAGLPEHDLKILKHGQTLVL